MAQVLTKQQASTTAVWEIGQRVTYASIHEMRIGYPAKFIRKGDDGVIVGIPEPKQRRAGAYNLGDSHTIEVAYVVKFDNGIQYMVQQFKLEAQN